MRFIIICLVINLVCCKRRPASKPAAENQDYSSDIVSSSEEMEGKSEMDRVLDFRGNVRKLFALELGLHANGQNVICSPLTAMMPLAKLLLGAPRKSKGHDELLRAVGLEDIGEFKETFRQILKDLKSLQGVELSLASVIYISHKLELQEKFKSRTEKVFKSSIVPIDVKRPSQVVNKVNDWVATHTKNKIQNLISTDDIYENLSLILVNAIYFKGTWREPFKPAIVETFYTPHGYMQVPLMNIRSHFNYVQSDELKAKIVELPYSGDDVAMIIVLPYDKEGLPALLRMCKSSQDTLITALAQMKTMLVDVTIPKISIDTTLGLIDSYRNMGIENPLDREKSDLSKIVKNQTVYISFGRQKAMLEITEEGTVAAAASVVALYPVMAPMMETLALFRADHPFLFYIRGRHEQLFAGVVITP